MTTGRQTKNGGGGVADISWLASQDFTQHGAQAKHVGSFIEIVDVAARLFRRHVGGRPHHASELRVRTVTAEPAECVAAQAIPQCLDVVLLPLTFTRQFLVCHATVRKDFGQSPVHHLHFAKVAHHDVGGFQIAVDDAPRVGVCHRLAYLFEDADEFTAIRRGVGAFRQEFCQRFAFDQLHAEIRPLVGKLS